MNLVDALVEWSGSSGDESGWVALRRALSTGVGVLSDRAMEDVRLLREASTAATVASIGPEQLLLLSALPARFAAGYDVDFAASWAVAVQDMGERTVRDWRLPRSLAESLAWLCILAEAEDQLGGHGEAGPGDGGRSPRTWSCRLRCDLLLDPALDGVDDSDVGRLMRLPSFRFADWSMPSGASTW